jgi:beta-lactamase regulating signal transducer with metallopeptidase domain
MQHALVEYLINAAWQVPLVAVGAALVAHIAGLSPRGRNAAWLGFLAMAVVLPALPLGISTHHAARPAKPAETAMVGVSSVDAAAANLDVANPSRLLHVELNRGSADLIGLTFVTAAAVALARLAVAGSAAQALVRNATEVVLPDEVARALEAFACRHACPVPPVRQSAEIATPVVVGALRPVILIPKGFVHLAHDDQQAALLHEFAHVHRRDYAVNLACEVVAVPLSWHPALYEIKAGVRRSRELACDAMAATAMASQEAYARRLLSLAKTLGRPTAEPSAALVGLFGKSDLEDRLMHLLAPKSVDHQGRRMARLGGAAALTALALTPAVLFRVTPAVAQSQPAPTASAVKATPAATAAPAAPAVAAIPAKAAAPAQPAAPAAAGAAALATPIERTRHDATPAGDGGVDAVHRQVTADVDCPDEKRAAVVADADARAADRQRRLQAKIQRIMDKAAATRQRRIASPEFSRRLAETIDRQTQMASIDREALKKQLRAATAAVDNAHVQEEIARARERIASEAVRQGLATAERMRREAEASARDAEVDAEPSK